jgi:hypothetical protein
MYAKGVAVGKIICIHCRRSDCAGPCLAAPRVSALKGGKLRTLACLSGACLAGSVFGALVALLFGG